MAWIKLKQLDNAVVVVSSDQIVRIRAPIAEAPSANAVIDFTNGQSQAVLETISEVLSLLPGQADTAGAASA